MSQMILILSLPLAAATCFLDITFDFGVSFIMNRAASLC